jgi:hypothetical protein
MHDSVQDLQFFYCFIMLVKNYLFSACALLRKEKHGPAVVAIAGGRGKGGIAIWNPKGDN